MALRARCQTAESALHGTFAINMTNGSPRWSRPLWAVFAVGCGVILYYAHAAFIPVALAFLFALVLSSPVEALHRRGLPRFASALLIMLSILALVAGAVYELREPAQAWLAAAPRTVRNIERKIDPAARVLHRIGAVTERAGHLTDGAGTQAPVPATVVPVEEAGLLGTTRSVAVALVTVIILTLFMLAGGPPMLARMTATVASNVQATHVLKVMEAVRREVGRYYATIGLINLGLGIATGLVMWALGMPNPVLWGAMAGVLNFIPYAGSATTLVVLTIVAFVSFDDIGKVLLVAGSYLGLATIEGQVVQPLLVGQRLALNPIIVFLALWFGGWLWGIAGIVMAVPLLVTLKVIAEHSACGQPMVEFLSPGRPAKIRARRPVPSP
jgi:predicted PurR-regulated permease PerM